MWRLLLCPEPASLALLAWTRVSGSGTPTRGCLRGDRAPSSGFRNTPGQPPSECVCLCVRAVCMCPNRSVSSVSHLAAVYSKQAIFRSRHFREEGRAVRVPAGVYECIPDQRGSQPKEQSSCVALRCPPDPSAGPERIHGFGQGGRVRLVLGGGRPLAPLGRHRLEWWPEGQLPFLRLSSLRAQVATWAPCCELETVSHPGCASDPHFRQMQAFRGCPPRGPCLVPCDGASGSVPCPCRTSAESLEGGQRPGQHKPVLHESGGRGAGLRCEALVTAHRSVTVPARGTGSCAQIKYTWLPTSPPV